MKFFSALTLGIIVAAADAAYPNPDNSPPDACYTAVSKPIKQRPIDCKSFLLTTVTPKKSTIYKTSTITKKTPTVTKSITVTRTSPATATSINSVVQTVTDNIVVTRTVEQTKTVTEQTTTTVTTEVADPAPTLKRKRSVPRIPEYLDNLCTNSAQYSSACSRIGVTAKTVTAPRVTVATKTVTETTTKTEVASPLETVKLIALGSNDPALLGGIGLSSLESYQGSSTSFYMDFTYNAASQVYTIHKVTGEVKAFNGPGSATGLAASYNYYAGSGNPYGSVMIQRQGGAPSLVCKVLQGEGYRYLQCNFGTNKIAEFWTCNQRLVMVYPDVSYSRCYMDGEAYTGYKIPYIQVVSV
ncbi:hypothetical protein ACHAP8_005866 [Fusarium lateritium]